jgi:hypothetical protein
MRKLFYIFIFLIICKVSYGQVYIEEFNYTAGTALTANGWTQSGATATNPISVAASGLTYTNYPSVAGRAATLVTSGQDIYKSFASQNAGSVYLSFLLNVQSTAATGDYFVALSQTTATQTNYYDRFFIKTSGAGYVLGISKNGETTTYGASVLSLNTTYLIVIKHTFNVASTTDDTETVYYFSDPTIPAAEPGAAEIGPFVAASKTDPTSLSVVNLRQGTASNAPNLTIDGLRVDTTWPNLLFLPSAPTATAASGVSSTGFTANWNSVGAASSYNLEVATDAAFTAPVAGYSPKSVVGTSSVIVGLTNQTPYYYRVSAYNATSTLSSAVSNTVAITTIDVSLGSVEGANLAYTENDAATVITSTTAVSCSAVNLSGAVIQITGNYKSDQDVLSFTNADGITGSWNSTTGTLTLSGSSAFANYQTALRNVKYSNTSEGPNTSVRTVSFSVNDGTTSSNTATRNISVTSVNDLPVLGAMEGTTLIYVAGTSAQITSNLTVSDLDNSNMSSATVQITGNYSSGNDLLLFTNQNGISGTWTAATGTLALSGAATLANYQTALRSIQFRNASSAPSLLLRTVSFTVNDGTSSSVTVTRDINFDNPPHIASIEANALTYNAGDPATAVTSTITVTDSDNATLQSAVVKFSGYFEVGNDVLSCDPAAGITPVWNGATGTLTLTGNVSVAGYQSTLRSVTFQNISASPSKLLRTVSFTVNDGLTDGNTVTRNINLGYIALGLGAIEPDPFIYQPGCGDRIITSSVVISSPSWPTISSATIQITKNYISGEDILSFTNADQISGTWDATTGKLELSGSASVASYQAALRSVTYKNTNASPNLLPRTITFVINDGYNQSNAVSRVATMAVLKNITLTANTPEGGTVTGGGAIYTGVTATVKAIPSVGYSFVNWTENGNAVSTDSSYSFTVSEDRSLTANFTNIKYTLATISNPSVGGTTTGGGTYNHGTSVTVVAVPQSPYVFVNWTCGDSVVATTPSHTFTITSSQTLTANFVWPTVLTVTPDVITVGPSAGTYTINVSNTGGGTLNWSAVSDIFWIKITNGSSGTDNGMISISYNHNNSIARVGTITITAPGVAGSPKKIEVRQSESVTGVENIGAGIPTAFRLEQNYPNPFNPTTKIRFGLPKESNVVVTVYNIMGEEIAKLVDGQYSAGYYEVDFDASRLSSGLYLYMISAGDFRQVKKMMLTK